MLKNKDEISFPLHCKPNQEREREKLDYQSRFFPSNPFDNPSLIIASFFVLIKTLLEDDDDDIAPGKAGVVETVN